MSKPAKIIVLSQADGNECLSILRSTKPKVLLRHFLLHENWIAAQDSEVLNLVEKSVITFKPFCLTQIINIFSPMSTGNLVIYLNKPVCVVKLPVVK